MEQDRINGGMVILTAMEIALVIFIGKLCFRFFRHLGLW